MEERTYSTPLNKLLLNFEVQYIYTFLKIEDVDKARLVSKLFHSFLSDDDLWEGLIKRDFKLKQKEIPETLKSLSKREIHHLFRSFFDTWYHNEDINKQHYSYEHDTKKLFFKIDSDSALLVLDKSDFQYTSEYSGDGSGYCHEWSKAEIKGTYTYDSSGGKYGRIVMITETVTSEGGYNQPNIWSNTDPSLSDYAKIYKKGKILVFDLVDFKTIKGMGQEFHPPSFWNRIGT